nr:MAG TPA: hypothetical protein [Caudoviricetes sp.]DAK25476.1 MAG TPA: hypothetical protein [Caudoviricetes sp.]DAT99533.1 MAG TPA: hypothetical protein [Caudoviricetes sp.]
MYEKICKILIYICMIIALLCLIGMTYITYKY